MPFPTAITGVTNNPRLRLLNALRENRKPIMTFMGVPSFRHAQMVASTGLDGIIIDCEHGHISDDSMHSAVAGRWMLVHSEPKKYIHRGFVNKSSGIVVPQINTAEEAAAIVSHAKFPPQGLRGQGSAFPAIAHGIDTQTYLKTANETLITCVQIESKAGVENMDAIAAVPGVDMLFIGPNDLALSVLGYVPARGDEPEFADAIEKILTAARKHSKWVGRLSNDGASSRAHLTVFDAVAMSYDIRAVQNWYRAELQAARIRQTS